MPELQHQDMIEDMSMIQGGVEETQFMNETDDFGLFEAPKSGGQANHHQQHQRPAAKM